MNSISTTYLLEQGQLAAIEVGNAKMAEVSVIFIHGWLDNAASFLSLMPALHALILSCICARLICPVTVSLATKRVTLHFTTISMISISCCSTYRQTNQC